MTPEEIAQEVRAEYVYTSDYGFVAFVAAAILAYGDARAAEERARAVRIASRVFDNPYALHPDVSVDRLNESARTAAHSIAQTIAGLIADKDHDRTTTQ